MLEISVDEGIEKLRCIRFPNNSIFLASTTESLSAISSSKPVVRVRYAHHQTRESALKINNTAATQSILHYLEGDITGEQLSQALRQIADDGENLDKKQLVSFKYYIDFFEKEGKNQFLRSNKYLKEEVDELSGFIESLNV